MVPQQSAAAAPATEAKTESPAAPQAPAAPTPAAPSGGDPKTDAAKPLDVEAVMRQLNDQTKANKKLGRNNIQLLEENKRLKAEMQELRTKFDSSYTPPAGPTPEQELAAKEFQAREAASRKVAEEKYGADFIRDKIFADDSPYRQLIAEQPWIHHRVMTSDTPILEAIDALNEHEVLSTFGRNPAVVLENVTKAIEPQLWTKWTQQAKSAPADQPGQPVNTLGDARGDSGVTSAAKPAPVFDLASFNRHIP